MQALPLKIQLTLITLFFLGLASRDLNIHHTRLSLHQKTDAMKVAALSPADLSATQPPRRIKPAN